MSKKKEQKHLNFEPDTAHFLLMKCGAADAGECKKIVADLSGPYDAFFYDVD